MDHRFTRRVLLRGGVAAGVAALFAPIEAQAAAWRLLARRSIRLVDDIDVMPVTWIAGSFTQIQLRVSRNAIFVDELRVTFSNGQAVSLPVRRRIREGGETPAIDLPGGRRFIRNVELHSRSVPNSSGRAIVEVWGMQ